MVCSVDSLGAEPCFGIGIVGSMLCDDVVCASSLDGLLAVVWSAAVVDGCDLFACYVSGTGACITWHG